MVIALTVNTRLWCAVVVLGTVLVVVDSLNGDHVCMVQQKYNITKRVKYRAPMSVRTYEWCFSMPPRCSKWKTEMRELTKLETDERIAEVAVCCPGYKMKDVSCVSICPNGRTGHRCSEDCPENKWGPNCVHECDPCTGGICSPITGECSCQDGWQGESCEIRMLPPTSTTTEDLLTKSATKPTPPITSTLPSTRASVATTLETTSATLIEFTTRLSNLKPVIATPVSLSNITLIEATISSKTPLLEKTSSSTTLPMLETTSLSFTKKPTAAVKATTPVTLPMTTPTSTSTSKIFNTEAITMLPSKGIETLLKNRTTTEIITKNLTPIQNQYHNELQSIQTSTVTSFTKEKTTVDKIYKKLPITSTELPKTKQIHIFTEHATTDSSKFRVIEKTTLKMPSEGESFQVETLNVPKTMHELKVPVKVAFDKIETTKTTTLQIPLKNITDIPHTTIALTTEGSTKTETAKRPQSTIRYFPTTVKFKPKEIWIRPAQKGEPYKSKTETNQDLLFKPRSTLPNTTPKTIIVSIIPTSVSYATFKKIALSTTSLQSLKMNTTEGSPNTKSGREVTKPMLTISTATESSRTTLINVKTTHKFLITSKLNQTENSNTSKSKFDSTSHTTREFPEKSVSQNGTNGMISIRNLNSSNSLTTFSINSVHNVTQEPTTKLPVLETEKVTRPVKIVTVKPRNVTIITVSGKNKNETVVKITKTIAKDVEKTNATTKNTNQVTTESADDEEFHILTEPEHITAVMEGKGKERSSVDLISVISIAGGIMMAVITVAVIIVMVERCKRPRYDDGRKVSDIRMQVMIESNDVPPPYVRSIFHTPLPDPPTSEKCHYQPISTLDRNLKQFMRPVVVQTISPIMLENFRGILECHYDHLPRRSHQYDPRHCTVAASMEDVDELTRLRPCSAMDSTIEALKCEARQDVIDSSTSEPLYAEIPCWRPPSEHAVEILNLNEEAVTEL